MSGVVSLSKMNKKLVLLCSTAIAGVYTAGYFTTETQAISQPTAQVSQANSSVVSAAKLYADGTFTGMGRNRRGSINVAVTVKNDKITDVEISHFAMHYSMRDVVGLPSKVLQNQSAQVDNVSGATYSTEAFTDAVRDALSQAQHSLRA